MLSDWKYPVGAAIGAALTLAGCLLWYEGLPWVLDGRVDHVQREAAAGMVSKAELTAAEAEAGELRRQVESGRKAIATYASQLALTRAAQAAAEQTREQEIATYEQRLEAAGRSCRLDLDDLDWLRKP